MKSESTPMQIIRTVLGCAVLVLAFATAYGQDQVEVKGMIIGRTGDTMTMRTADSPKLVVVLDDETKVQVPKGVFKARHEQMSMAELMPGLRVKVKGTRNPDGQVVARTIEFSSNDLKIANAIQSGLVPTQQAVESNKQSIAANQQNIETNKQQIATNQQEVQVRFASLSEYEVKGSTEVYFKSGSAELSDQAKSELMQLANNAANLKGYLIQVKGFCDSTGTAAQNQVLSRDRAEAVVAFLLQSAQVPLRHILAPGAMGTVGPAASNESAAGRSKNRRVEVKVLVNKGVAG